LIDAAGVHRELGGGAADALDVELQRSVETPVLRGESGEIGGVHRVVVVVGDGMIEQQRDGIDEVLHVDLVDLQLAEQKIGRGESRTVVVEAASQFDDMTHLHPVDEDVDLSTVQTVEIEQSLVPVEGVESQLALVTKRLEQPLHGWLLFGSRDEVEVPISALQWRLPGAGRMQVDGRAAHELDWNFGLLRGRRNPLRLGDDVADGDVDVGRQLRPPARRR